MTQSPESVEGRILIGVAVGWGIYRNLVESAERAAEMYDHLADAN
jgi:hypothetical protein